MGASDESERRGLLPHCLFIFAGRLANDLVQAECHVYEVLVHEACFVDRLDQWYRDNVVAAQRHHRAEFAMVHHVNGAYAVARREYPVERAWRPAALNVPQHDRPRFESSPPLDFSRQYLPDAAQPHVPESVAAKILHDRRAMFHVQLAGELCPFRGHYDAEVAPACVPPPQRFRDSIDVKGMLRD